MGCLSINQTFCDYHIARSNKDNKALREIHENRVNRFWLENSPDLNPTLSPSPPPPPHACNRRDRLVNRRVDSGNQTSPVPVFGNPNTVAIKRFG